MTSKEKLQFFIDNGMSLTYITKQMQIDLTTLSKWLKGQKNLSKKNEDKMLVTLKNIVENFQRILE